ncbi:hypothetical protein KCH_04970 [Kitasatospora cheerisanensis KCTC 2395]|uniref:Uncharacterized protein n=1 Tax=Kitasatospora cheerisanensis KCTC 2395 TaxID=1348663 RepID=A0A066ZCH9_9ACTN|nr:hypothetical protein KCH_04970 [Kitasatospora cheerisanensis KCTC 2395]
MGRAGERQRRVRPDQDAVGGGPADRRPGRGAVAVGPAPSGPAAAARDGRRRGPGLHGVGVGDGAGAVPSDRRWAVRDDQSPAALAGADRRRPVRRAPVRGGARQRVAAGGADRRGRERQDHRTQPDGPDRPAAVARHAVRRARAAGRGGRAARRGPVLPRPAGARAALRHAAAPGRAAVAARARPPQPGPPGQGLRAGPGADRRPHPPGPGAAAGQRRDRRRGVPAAVPAARPAGRVAAPELHLGRTRADGAWGSWIQSQLAGRYLVETVLLDSEAGLRFPAFGPEHTVLLLSRTAVLQVAARHGWWEQVAAAVARGSLLLVRVDDVEAPAELDTTPVLDLLGAAEQDTRALLLDAVATLTGEPGAG